MKICMFVLDFPYKTSKGVLNSGGAGTIVKQLCDSLYKEGIDVSVVAGKLSDYKSEVVSYKVYRVPNIFFGVRESKALGGILMTLKSFSLPDDFDIIHSHNPPGFLASYLFSKKIKKPNILTLHGPWADLRKSTKSLANSIEKFCIMHADEVIAVSNSLRERLEQKYDRKDIVVIQNWVDTDVFKPVSIKEKKRLRNEFNLPTDKFIIIYTGRFVREKRVDDILNSIPLVTKKAKDVLFLLVGGGFDQKIIHDWIKKNPDCSKYIKIIPFLPHDKMSSILNTADIFVLPSEAEGMSISLLEAMAAGLPCIVSNIPANRELINLKNGSLYDLGNVDELADILISYQQNKNKAKRIGLHARQTVSKKYLYKFSIKNYITIYKKVAKKFI